MNNLSNKKIVITGASSGIGEEVAVRVAKLGARPILIARSEGKLKEISRLIEEQYSVGCLYYALDVSEQAEVEKVFAEILHDEGQIDVLLNNAGFGIFDTFIDANMDDIVTMFNVNVLGLMACTKAVLPSMMERNRGHIINVASQAGKL